MDTLAYVVPGTSHDYKEYIAKTYIGDPPGPYFDTADKTNVVPGTSHDYKEYIAQTHIGDPPGPSFDTVDKTNVKTERPAHYKTGNIECIDALKDLMSEDEFIGFCRANCIKYLWRYPNKGGLKDLNKAKQYLDWLIEACEAKYERVKRDIK